MGGRGPSSPNGSNGPLRGSESAEIRSHPYCRSGRRRRRASRGASGAWILRAGLRISADSEPRRGPFG
eukprot:9137521-Alexandrium_andersonii.AAC.1